ncbi:FtsK/spoIIIE family [Rubidibacter lacunae KORDI 51-2]|uniref:FtsK/spoIIIE family n=1 Tax=Rubidibacter lacunae KORDI 51-2 TaxID=582515 RepID=U5DK96_9CHRO|nr:type IV secretion system DNA-binding domain-containing protein [Rubidibacter lacunae]ERN41342.1 FtsK/spoIIIE family [Rubidibacter lacunae KORDI 51-2]
MFAKEKPLPAAAIPPKQDRPTDEPRAGIFLGTRVTERHDGGIPIYWNLEALANGHVAAIGASGSGKTQTLKAIAYALHQQYEQLRLVVLDFHGDQQLPGERAYQLHLTSAFGVNPLVIHDDPEGGGPDLQAIDVAHQLSKILQMGPNQQGLLMDSIKSAYLEQGILQSDRTTWQREAPNFSDLQEAIASSEHKGADELKLKMAALFMYGVFSRPQLPLGDRLIRVDLHKLPEDVAALAAETIARQLLNRHRLDGEIDGKLPRTYLVVDECKVMPRGEKSACSRIAADGRKFGLAMVVASQSERHISADVIGNCATQIVLPVAAVEAGKVSKKFRVNDRALAKLKPLWALVRSGTQLDPVQVEPFYKRVAEEEA